MPLCLFAFPCVCMCVLLFVCILLVFVSGVYVFSYLFVILFVCLYVHHVLVGISVCCPLVNLYVYAWPYVCLHERTHVRMCVCRIVFVVCLFVCL